MLKNTIYKQEDQRPINRVNDYKSKPEDQRPVNRVNDFKSKPSLLMNIARYATILLAVVLYKGSEEMHANSQQQYVYHYLKDTLPVTTVSTQNESKAHDCPGASSNKTGNEAEAQAYASRWELYFNSLWMGVALITVTIYGITSDFLGRKFIVVIPVLGFAFKALFSVFIIHFKLDITYFLLATGLDGLGGTQYTFVLSWATIVADVIPVGKRRYFYLALFQAAQGLGRLSTNFAVGYFIQIDGFFWPTVTSTITCFTAAIIFYLTVPETMNTTTQRSVSSKAVFSGLVNFYTDKSTFKSRRLFWLVQAVLFFTTLPVMSKIGLMVLEQLGTPFCWDPELIGWYGALIQLLQSVLGPLLLKPLQYMLHDDIITIFGIVSDVAFYVTFGLADKAFLLFIAAVLGTLSSIPTSVLQGMASNTVVQEKQGALFASLSLTSVVCRLVSSSIFNNIYSETVSVWRGTAMLTMAGCSFIGVLIMTYYTIQQRTCDLDLSRNDYKRQKE